MNKKQRNRKIVSQNKRNRIINRRYTSTIKTLSKLFLSKVKIINNEQTSDIKSQLKKESLALELYGNKIINERHRHRYEVNHEFTDQYSKKGFHISGASTGSGLVEIMEMDKSIHPYFIGTQAHPEFKSRLLSASPLFKGLIAAAVKNKSVVQTIDKA